MEDGLLWDQPEDRSIVAFAGLLGPQPAEGAQDLFYGAPGSQTQFSFLPSGQPYADYGLEQDAQQQQTAPAAPVDAQGALPPQQIFQHEFLQVKLEEAAAAQTAAAQAEMLNTTPPGPALPPSPSEGVDESPLSFAPLCYHCETRLRSMKASDSAQCAAGARMWETAWKNSGVACFGACLAPEFCLAHGLPLPACTRAHPEGKHSIVVYRGMWVKPRCSGQSVISSSVLSSCKRTPEEVPSSSEADAAPEPTPPPVDPHEAMPSSHKRPRNAGPPPVGGCRDPGECGRRLRKLLSVDWAGGASRDAVAALVARGASGECLGFCSTPYCCKVHWCPARVRAPASTPAAGSRYACDSGPHDSSRKGRHQADFAYYCSDAGCCNGRWYSRDETHRRKVLQAASVASTVAMHDSLMSAPKMESASINTAAGDDAKATVARALGEDDDGADDGDEEESEDPQDGDGSDAFAHMNERAAAKQKELQETTPLLASLAPPEYQQPQSPQQQQQQVTVLAEYVPQYAAPPGFTFVRRGLLRCLVIAIVVFTVMLGISLTFVVLFATGRIMPPGIMPAREL